MSKMLPLLQGQITLEDGDNMLHALILPWERFEFFVRLWKHRGEIEAIVSYHLGLFERVTCQIGKVKDRVAGSFNVCIGVPSQQG